MHLYQPPTQTEVVFRKVCSECYVPLIKLIKNNPQYRFSLNVPLSFLEQMDFYGYNDWINDLKNLCDSERVEVVGSAAYHALLTKTPSEMIEQQIILNEYGLGYYLGSKQGFEGEDSILMKNLKGFFPPELSLNDEVFEKIDDLGYEWILADRCAVPQSDSLSLGQNIFKYKNFNTLLLIRDCDISNMISFKRDSMCDDVIAAIQKKSETVDSIIIASDGETFGHHNKEGIYLLDSIADWITRNGYNLSTISDIVADTLTDNTETLHESNWSETVCVLDPEKIYTLWDNPSNKIQQLLWGIQHAITEKYLANSKPITEDGFENVCIWKQSELAKMTGDSRQQIELTVLVNKSLHSDQFWWASGETIYDTLLFSAKMVEKALDIYKELAARMLDKDLITLVDAKSSEISTLLGAEADK